MKGLLVPKSWNSAFFLSEYFHLSTQAMKFAFAQRSLLEDSDNLKNITEQMLRYCAFKLLARRPSSRPKDGHFSEMGGFRRPVLGGNLRTSVRNVTKQCV